MSTPFRLHRVRVLQVRHQRLPEVGALEREGDVGLEEAEAVAGVVALPLEPVAEQPLLAGQHGERVGELDLAPHSRLHVLQDREDLGRQDVAADHRQVGGGVLLRLLDQLLDADGARVQRRPGGDAVHVGLGRRDLHEGDGSLAVPLEAGGELLRGRHGAVDDVVAQHDDEGLVADERLGAEHGVAEPQRLLLPHRDHVGHLGDGPHLGPQGLLAGAPEVGLQLGRDVEVVHDRVLAAGADQDHLVHAGRHRLLDDVLDRRAIDDGQELLGHGLGGREEAGAEAGGGDDGLADLLHGRRL